MQHSTSRHLPFTTEGRRQKPAPCPLHTPAPSLYHSPSPPRRRPREMASARQQGMDEHSRRAPLLIGAERPRSLKARVLACMGSGSALHTLQSVINGRGCAHVKAHMLRVCYEPHMTPSSPPAVHGSIQEAPPSRARKCKHASVL